MKQPLVITELRTLPRLLDILLTLLAWFAFIWLVYHGVITVLQTSHEMDSWLQQLVSGAAKIYYLVALAVIVMFLGWAKYNQIRFQLERRQRQTRMTDEELSESLGLPLDLYRHFQELKVFAVDHCADGKVMNIRAIDTASTNTGG